MPVQLSSMRSVLLPGLNFMCHAHEPLCLDDVPARYKHLRSIFHAVSIKTVGDLHRIPKRFECEGNLYETKMVFLKREYPQGWGRGPGGAAAEPPPEPDGKVDVFVDQDNNNMATLKKEIENFISGQGWYGL